MNQASVFECYKRFKEDRESVRGVGGVRKSEHQSWLAKIKNFMDKDRRVSIETISAQFDVSVGTVHTIIPEELKMQKICAKFLQVCSEKIRKKGRCHDSREMVEVNKSDRVILDALVTCDENWI